MSISSATYAQEFNGIFSQLEEGLISLKNPFESQLPRKEGPIVEDPVIIDGPGKTEPPPKPELTCADDITYCSNAPDCFRRGYFWYDNSCNTGPKPPEPVAPPPPIIERSLPNVSISGIIWNSDRPQAIINGQIVDVGDTVMEIEITDIQKTGIDGLFDGRAVTLKP